MSNTRSVLRGYCRCAYIAGVGDCWFESPNEPPLYKAYTYLSFAIYTTMILLENMAAFFGDFPGVEKNSAIIFAAIHDLVLPKMYLILYHKKSIRRLNEEMSVVGAELETRGTMRRQYRRVKIGLLLYMVSVYLSLIAYGVESARKMYVEDAPFYSVVTYLPKYEDTSNVASFLRVFFYATWLYMMLPMMSADCFPITHLIAMSYKFVSLCQHFEKLNDDFSKNLKVKGSDEAVRKLKEGFLEGVRMHQKLLALTGELRRVFGVIMSLQVCESSAVAVLLLLRLALSPRMNLTNAVMTYTFVGSLFLLLALNLWNAGELTHQASLLSNAMAHSGWQRAAPLSRSHRDPRRLVLLGCAQAQRPLVLKAFGMQDLSYETFVSVVKMTYSVFAVFYDRGS